MGTLDDAIREHLELKRRHGADDDELKELEDSAFGPPERPGEAAPSPPSEQAAPPPVAEPDATTVMETGEPAQQAEPVDIGADQVEAPGEPRAAPEPQAGDDELTPAERARQEHPHLQDTVAHEPVAGPAPVQSTEEQDALEISLFESGDDEEDFDIGEVDLGLEDDEEVEEIEDDSEEMEIPPEESAREHSVLDSRQSVVDPDPTDESAVAAPEPEGGEDADEEPERSVPVVDPDPTDEGHDVLEETPEFLKDAPESDEMWFEQDEPKDFDFD